MHAATASAPGRVNLIGEHVDYQAGLCLPMAIPQRTTATVTPRTDGRLDVTSADAHWSGDVGDLRPGGVEGWAAYVAGVVWALEDIPGAAITISSEVPIGAGLSSSAALECAVALALDDAFELGRTRRQLVTAAIRAEGEFVGAPTGGLDQYASLLTEPGHALLLDFRDDSTEQVPFPVAEAGLTLLVTDTRVSHAHADGGFGRRRAECDRAARALGVPNLRAVGDPAAGADLPEPLGRRVRHVVTENRRVRDFVAALGQDDWPRLGELMAASHVSLRDDFEVSAPELDVVVDTAVEHGALGARMTGGGFGGSAIALVPADARAVVEQAISAAFTLRDWAPPQHFTL